VPGSRLKVRPPTVTTGELLTWLSAAPKPSSGCLRLAAAAASAAALACACGGQYAGIECGVIRDRGACLQAWVPRIPWCTRHWLDAVIMHGHAPARACPSPPAARCRARPASAPPPPPAPAPGAARSPRTRCGDEMSGRSSHRWCESQQVCGLHRCGAAAMHSTQYIPSSHQPGMMQMLVGCYGCCGPGPASQLPPA
jgi:hypothetical protein